MPLPSALNPDDIQRVSGGYAAPIRPIRCRQVAVRRAEVSEEGRRENNSAGVWALGQRPSKHIQRLPCLYAGVLLAIGISPVLLWLVGRCIR